MSLKEYRSEDGSIHIPVFHEKIKDGKKLKTFKNWIHSSPIDDENIYSIPAKKLWLSVIWQAWHDLFCHEEAVKAEAKSWFFSKNKYQNSYLSLCAQLDLDPEIGKRSVILALRKRK